jgi:hypothetical protein
MKSLHATNKLEKEILDVKKINQKLLKENKILKLKLSKKVDAETIKETEKMILNHIYLSWIIRCLF